MYAAFAAVVAALCVVGLSACSGLSNNSNTASNDSQSSNETQKVPVVASFYPMADFAQKIGGDYVEVTNLCPVGTESHVSISIRPIAARFISSQTKRWAAGPRACSTT